MKWLIVFFMMYSDPFTPWSLEFETRNECVDYVNNPSNASRLAIEVIDVVGFNDGITAVVCLPESEVTEILETVEVDET
jgi:hypothetical protein